MDRVRNGAAAWVGVCVGMMSWQALAQLGDSVPYRDASLAVEQRLEDLISRMTLEEKLGQLSQGVVERTKKDVLKTYAEEIAQGRVGSYISNQMPAGPQLRNQLQRIAVERSRLGIPLLFGNDVIHGCHTVFPSSLGLACAWEPELFEKAQSVAAREARAEGIDWVFAPMCDIAMDPRWGRVIETCGEDPYLNGLCVAAQVRGFQGANPAAPGKVAACLKHFVGYGASTGGRDHNVSEISEFSLRNLHLPPFHQGVQAGAFTLMSGFNTIDQIPATADRHTLTDILRGEWGFKGFVVSDWDAVAGVKHFGYAASFIDAAQLALEAGNDMEMKTTHYLELADRIRAGELPLPVVDEAVRRVLRVKFLLGLFDQPYADEARWEQSILRPDDRALARTLAARSAVLLKNQKRILPIRDSVKRIAVIGPFATDADEMLGSWPCRGDEKQVVTLWDGLKRRFGERVGSHAFDGASLRTGAKTKTLADGSIVKVEGDRGDLAEQLQAAIEAAKAADLVILAVGETSAWTGESGSRVHLDLTGTQDELVAAVLAVGKPVVTVVFSGRPLAIPEIIDASAAVVYAWQPGIEAGNGLADLLSGDVAASGRLTISVPRAVGQVPVVYNRLRTQRADRCKDYRDMSREPLFPFGYGLTYTRFTYGETIVEPGPAGHPATASTTVVNDGEVAGDEVVQLYISALSCTQGIRPDQELRGFQRIHLKPGESRTVSFALTPDVLGYYGRDGAWRVDTAAYEVWISPHAHAGAPATIQLDR